MTAPIATSSAAPTSLIGSVTEVSSSLTTVAGVLRTSPLGADITVSKKIGASGGTLSIPQAGVTVNIPLGALASATVITMTARKGSLLAYDFAPHGITFKKPLTFTQQLAGTNATVLNAPLFQLGYYANPNQLTAIGGSVSELISGTVNLLNWTFSSSIQHFSGYMVAVGRGGSARDE